MQLTACGKIFLKDFNMDLFFLFLILPFFIYWCINEKTGLQLGIVFLLSIWVVFLFRYLDIRLPIDIDLRWIIVAVIFTGYIFLRGKLRCKMRGKLGAVLSKGNFRAYLISAAVVSFVIILYRPSHEFVFLGGFFMGMCAGYCVIKRYTGFKSNDVLQRTGSKKYITLFARFVLGMAGLALIFSALQKIILNFSESQNINLYGFLCYALLGFWVFAATPWIFIKLRLAGTDAGSDAAVR